MKSFRNYSGVDSVGVPPVPIPNTEVKPNCADDTRVWSPGKVGQLQIFYIKKPIQNEWAFFLPNSEYEIGKVVETWLKLSDL